MRRGDSIALSRFLTIIFFKEKGCRNGQQPPSFTQVFTEFPLCPSNISMDWLQTAKVTPLLLSMQPNCIPAASQGSTESGGHWVYPKPSTQAVQGEISPLMQTLHIPDNCVQKQPSPRSQRPARCSELSQPRGMGTKDAIHI